MSDPNRTADAAPPTTWPIQPAGPSIDPARLPDAPSTQPDPSEVWSADVTPDVTPDEAPGAPGAPRARTPRIPVRDAVRGWLHGRPLRTRLVAILVAALVLALFATGWGVQFVLRSYLVGQIDNDLLPLAQRASRDVGFLGALVQPDRRPFPSQNRIQVSVDGVATPVVIRGYTGNDDDAEETPTYPVLSSRTAAAREGTAYTVRASDGTMWRATSFASPVAITISGQQGPAAVTVVQSLAPVDRAVNRLRFFTLLIGAAAIATSALLGALAIRRAFKPLAEVEDTAAAIAAGDLSRRVPERPRTTEVGRLTASLNAMLSHIESAFRAREASEARTRRFAADASHELRTPLAAIRGFAELYRQGAVPPDEVPRTMRRIEDEATRMGGLVEDLLLLARLDEQRPGRSEQVDLTVLAGDAVHDAKGLDADRQVRLVGLRPGAGPGSSLVVGDEDRLRQVVANLVANAVRHTAPGTPVEVAVGTEEVAADDGGPAGPVAVIEVRDHGQGLPPEQAERVFERFFRLDSSRQRGRGGGSGLGLSIVAAVVAAHGGRVGVRSTPGGGATFRVVLPAAPAS